MHMRQFSELTPEEKIEAALAVVSPYGPVTEEHLLEIESFDPESDSFGHSKLQGEARSSIASLLAQWKRPDDAPKPKNRATLKDEPLYEIPSVQQQEVLDRLNVNIKSVKLHIANAGDKVLREMD